MSTLALTAPVRTTNPQNGQTGNSRRAAIIRTKQRAAIRSLVRLLVASELRKRPDVCLPCAVTLTRVSAGKLDAWDGLPAALKPVVDGVSDAFGVRDDDDRIRWERPCQRRGKRGEYAVEIRIEAA